MTYYDFTPYTIAEIKAKLTAAKFAQLRSDRWDRSDAELVRALGDELFRRERPEA